MPLLAPSALALALVMAAFGFLNTTVDVVMNAHGVALETKGGRSILSGLHAGWSFGGILGSLGVALALAIGLEPLIEVIIAAAIMWLVAVAVSRFLGHGSVRAEGRGRAPLADARSAAAGGADHPHRLRRGRPGGLGWRLSQRGRRSRGECRRLRLCGLFCGLFVARIGGDWAKDRIGSVRLIQLGMLLTAISIAAFLVVGSPLVALVGLFVAGVGIANVVPQIFGAAGRIPPHGPSLSAVFTSLTLTFMIGPTIIGGVADETDIGAALWLLVGASLVVALMVSRFPAAETNPRFRRTG